MLEPRTRRSKICALLTHGRGPASMRLTAPNSWLAKGSHPTSYLDRLKDRRRQRRTPQRVHGAGRPSTDVPNLRQMPQGPAPPSILIRSAFTLIDPFNRFRRLTLQGGASRRHLTTWIAPKSTHRNDGFTALPSGRWPCRIRVASSADTSGTPSSTAKASREICADRDAGGFARPALPLMSAANILAQYRRLHQDPHPAESERSSTGPTLVKPVAVSKDRLGT
jgi:hypothetical protein